MSINLLRKKTKYGIHVEVGDIFFHLQNKMVPIQSLLKVKEILKRALRDHDKEKAKEEEKRNPELILNAEKFFLARMILNDINKILEIRSAEIKC